MNENNPLAIIAEAARNPDINPEVMEKLLDMQERVLDRNAKQAFNADFVTCQATMPAIAKDTPNLQTKSVYARLDTINRYLLPHVTECGFALSFGTADSPMDHHVRVTAELIHKEGHCKEYFYDSPHDGAGIQGAVNKTPAHARASALTYGERYLTTMIFNIVVSQDDDGNAANSVQEYTQEQWDTFKELTDKEKPNPLGYAAFESSMADLMGPIRSRHLEAFRIEKGITKESDRLRTLCREGHCIADEYAASMGSLLAEDDISGIDQLVEELTLSEKRIVWAHMEDGTRTKIEKMRESA